MNELPVIYDRLTIELSCFRCKEKRQFLRSEENGRTKKIIWICPVCKRKRITDYHGNPTRVIKLAE